MKKVWGIAFGLLLVAALAAAAVVYSGVYDFAADVPHWAMTEKLIEVARTRYVSARARNVALPADLGAERRMRAGAGQYAEMCELCHLAPGVEDTPFRQGLYPRPPELARHGMDARESFWIIKHGLKMTGMPAWGPSHGDDEIWSIVAFMQELRELDARGYREMVRKAPADEEMKPQRGERAKQKPPAREAGHPGMKK